MVNTTGQTDEFNTTTRIFPEYKFKIVYNIKEEKEKEINRRINNDE